MEVSSTNLRAGVKEGRAVAEVFVSYKKEDRALAERLVAGLRAAGKSVWWDDALNPTQAWDAMIEREIAASRHVIVLWTPRSVASDWVRSEAHYAQDHAKLVPVIAEACTLPLAFMLRQAVDLSAGPLDDSNPQWTRLVSWLSDGPSEAGDDGGRAAALAATPVKALTGERWLGPARRPALAFGALALAVAVGAAIAFAWGRFAAPPQPSVVIDPLVLTGAKGLPDNFAKAVSDEMFANFSSSSRISPVVGDGRRRPHAYQLTGDVATQGDKVEVFSKLYAPDLDAPVMTFKLERPVAQKSLTLDLGLTLANLTRCVATASDSAGSKLTTLPSAAFAPWAQFCQQYVVGPSTVEAVAATLRKVVAEAPKFANGWSNLAEALYLSSGSTGVDRAAQQAEALRAADRALTLDPISAKAIYVKSWGVLGYLAQPAAGSDVARLHDFPAWEALALKSIRVRPSDCGCEVPAYAGMLAIFGRVSAAVPLMDRAATSDPTNVGTAQQRATFLAIAGRYADADKALSDLSEKWPQVRPEQALLALWRNDWASAQTMIDVVPDPQMRTMIAAVIEALARKDGAAAHAAAAPLLQVVANPDPSAWGAITLLASAGYTDEVAAAFETRVARQSVDELRFAFAPPFAAVRKTPRFAALVERLGLMDYWRTPGHRPDFCNEPDPPALCASVSKT
jgi:hypothetical protein